MMPDSAWLQGALRKVVAAVLGLLLALVLLVALLITGFYMLVNDATLALAPVLGEAGAMAVTGFFCILLLVLFFYRMTRPARSHGQADSGESSGMSSPVESLRNLIRKNPLESASIAFVLGIAEQGDPRLKSLLLQGGMVLMKEAEAERAAKPEHMSGSQPSDSQSETTQ